MAKLDRLLNLTAALIETRVPMTAEEIRARVPGYPMDSDDAFHRGFERDKDDLRELGVPIETVTVGHHEQPHAAYTIERERYELADPGFEPDELAAIHLAATAVQLEGLDPDDVEEGLRKLGGVTRDEAGPGASPIGAVPTPTSLLDLFVAVLERREVTFGYAGNERTVQPHRLQFERGRWYLTGHDLTRSARRSFRLDRVEGSVRSGDASGFAPPEERAGVRLRPWELGEGEAIPALLLLDPDIARAILNDDPALEVEERRDDGSVVVRLAVRNPAALRNFVLTLLDRAELLEPPELRAELLDWLRRFDLARWSEMSRVTATDRLQRILAVLPWILQHQGATVDEICSRFGLSRKELLDDLDLVFYNVGLHPFTPDMLAEVAISDDRVTVHLGDYFRRPLRLTHAEALTLLAAGRAMVARPGGDPEGALQRAVDKLTAALGDGAESAVDVALGDADPEVLEVVRHAVEQRHSLAIDYYSYGRDEHSNRSVDPYRVVSREGHWYLLGRCHTAAGERLFRIDRIRSAIVEESTFDRPSGDADVAPDVSRVERTVEIFAPGDASWVGDIYPCDELDLRPDGQTRIVLPVTATPWLERLMLRLGPGATARQVGEGPSLTDVGRSAARRILERYERGTRSERQQ